MFLPIAVDVPMERVPYVNWLLILGTIVTSFWFWGDPSESVLLGSGSILGWVGHIFIHADPIHLFGNMLFLWVFGNAICAKVGNAWFVPVYVGLGLIAGLAHMLFDGDLALGASGAINGIVGMYLVWYPLNQIRVLVMLGVHMRRVYVLGYWLILLWFVFDIYGAIGQERGVAHFAHIGGFVGGVGLAAFLVWNETIVMMRYESSLFHVFQWSTRYAVIEEVAGRGKARRKNTRFEDESVPSRVTGRCVKYPRLGGTTAEPVVLSHPSLNHTRRDELLLDEPSLEEPRLEEPCLEEPRLEEIR